MTLDRFATAGMERRPLAPGIFVARVLEDIVVLDTRADAYSCLPEAARVLEIIDQGIAASPDILEHLTKAGVLTPQSNAPARLPLPAPPLRTLVETRPSGGRAGDAALFWWTVIQAGRRLKRLALADLLAEPRPGSGSDPDTTDTHRIASLTAVFANRLPWVPGQGACLYRAYALRRLLRAAGQDAQWVFGVRTWPFSAHCWLQVGDAVLDDDVDRVGTYTPIMAA